MAPRHSPTFASADKTRRFAETSVKIGPKYPVAGRFYCPLDANMMCNMSDPPTVRDSGARSRIPIVFGEVLFDCFPDGRQILGGAPFNVAWNLQGLGLAPCFISGVGEDEDGTKIRQAMSAWEMSLDGLQTIADRPTGSVSVSLDQGQPAYEINLDQAYDFITLPDLSLLSNGAGLIYHGSLIFRGPVARESLLRLVTDSDLPRFVDINIRQPHFDTRWLPDLISGAKWIKINDEELQQLSGIEITGPDSIQSGIAVLRRRYGGETYLVTCGAAGAYAVENDKLIHVPAPTPLILQDTVGAGDSFSAAMIAGIMHESPIGDSLKVAARLASRICGITGGTLADTSLYHDLYQ